MYVSILIQVSLSQSLKYISRVPIVKYTSEIVVKEMCKALKQVRIGKIMIFLVFLVNVGQWNPFSKLGQYKYALVVMYLLFMS